MVWKYEYSAYTVEAKIFHNNCSLVDKAREPVINV